MPFTDAKTRDGSGWTGEQTSRVCNSLKCEIYILGTQEEMLNEKLNI